MMFYPHNIEESRNRSNERAKLAFSKYGLHTNVWFAEYNLLHLQEIGEIGLPDCYKEVGDFLYDFWPNFPWKTQEHQVVVTLILGDARWPAIREAVKLKIGIDMDIELRKSYSFNTAVIVLNDALSSIENDPEFGKKLSRAISNSNLGRVAKPQALQVNCNGFSGAATVLQTHHADCNQLVVVGDNQIREFASLTPEHQLKYLAHFAAQHGYKLVKKPTKK